MTQHRLRYLLALLLILPALVAGILVAHPTGPEGVSVVVPDDDWSWPEDDWPW